MIVRTPEMQFSVIRVVHATPTEQMSVCRDLLDPQGQLYTLACFRNVSLHRTLLPVLSAEIAKPTFDDFLDLFTENGAVFARFRYYEGPTLSEQLAKRELSLRERLHVAGALLERMSLLDMSHALQLKALDDHNIIVDDTLSVRFNYILDSISACFDVDMGVVDMPLVSLRLHDILAQIFEPQLAAKSTPELVDFLAQVNDGIFPCYLDVYAAFDQVATLLLSREEAQAIQPQTWLFRLWNKIKKMARLAKPFLAGLLVVAALCYLIYTLLRPPVPTGTPIVFNTIGTIDVTPPPLAPLADGVTPADAPTTQNTDAPASVDQGTPPSTTN